VVAAEIEEGEVVVEVGAAVVTVVVDGVVAVEVADMVGVVMEDMEAVAVMVVDREAMEAEVDMVDRAAMGSNLVDTVVVSRLAATARRQLQVIIRAMISSKLEDMVPPRLLLEDMGQHLPLLEAMELPRRQAAGGNKLLLHHLLPNLHSAKIIVRMHILVLIEGVAGTLSVLLDLMVVAQAVMAATIKVSSSACF